jgi:hypothetical protein
MKENGFTVNKYDSGWTNQRLRFTVTAGENRHFVEINAGKWLDDNKNTIYAFSEPVNGEKSKPIQIAWDKRNDPETIKGVAGWRVFTIDLDSTGHRNELRDGGDKEALAASYEKRHHFLAATDFCDFVNSVINDPSMKDVKFRVKGNINYNYSDNTDRYYETYEVNKIYMVDEDEAVTSEVNLDFYFDEDAFDESMFEEYGKVNVNGYTTFYDNATKKNWFTPITLVVRDKVAGWKKTFSKFEDDEVRKVGLTCQKINGAQKVNITLADLDEDTQENVALGLITEEEAIRDAGGQMFGDAIRELRIEKLGRGYARGSETTAYSAADLTKKPVKEEEVIDIFGSDDEDDDL